MKTTRKFTVLDSPFDIPADGGFRDRRRLDLRRSRVVADNATVVRAHQRRQHHRAGVPLTENFDTLASAGTGIAWADNSTIPGWYSTRTAYNSGTGSSNTGALYSFGVAGTNPVTDRALGSVASGGTGTVFQAARLTNNTGGAITSLDVSYTGEQWRNGGNATAHTLTFQYQVAAPGRHHRRQHSGDGWTTVPALSFTGPVAGATAATLDGNAAANRLVDLGDAAGHGRRRSGDLAAVAGSG